MKKFSKTLISCGIVAAIMATSAVGVMASGTALETSLQSGTNSIFKMLMDLYTGSLFWLFGIINLLVLAFVHNDKVTGPAKRSLFIMVVAYILCILVKNGVFTTWIEGIAGLFG